MKEFLDKADEIIERYNNKSSVIKLKEKVEEVNYGFMFYQAKWLMWVLLFFVAILKFCGISVVGELKVSENFQIIVDYINAHSWLRIAVKSFINISVANIMYYCIVENYFQKNNLLVLNLILTTYSIIFNILLEFKIANIFTVLLSYGMYFLPIIYKCKIKKCLYILIVDFTFQTISLITKSLFFQWDNPEILHSIILALDYYIMWTIYLLNKKGERLKCHYLELDLDFLQKNMQKLNTNCHIMYQHLKKQKPIQKEHICVKKLKLSKKIFYYLKILKLKAMNLKCWIKYTFPIKFKFKILPLIIFVSVYFGYAIMRDKVFESVVLYLFYGAFRYMFPREFHADYIPNIRQNQITLICVLLTCLTLCSALYNTCLAEISLLGSVVIAFVLDWILYVITIYLQVLIKKNKNGKE